jgi:hypothetical protein
MPEQLPYDQDEHDEDSYTLDESYDWHEETLYPEESAFQVATAKIHKDLADYQQTENPILRKTIIDRIDLQLGAYMGAMSTGDYELEDLPVGVKTLGSILRVTGQNEYKLLGLFPDTVVQETYQDDPSDINAMLEDAAKTSNWQLETKNTLQTTEYQEILEAYQLATAVGHGLMYTLRKEGAPSEDLPEYLKPLVADKDFAFVAVKDVNGVEYGKDGEEETSQEQMSRLRFIEREILQDVCGIPAEVAKQTRIAIEKRTLKRDKDGFPITMMSPDAGMDTASWHKTMAAIAESTKDLSTKDLQELHDATNIVNFDRYSSEQLQRTLKAFQGDPESIKHLQNGDVAFTMTDAFGDYNGALEVGNLFDPDSRTISTEINSPVALYRPMIEFYKATGVKPSTLVVGAHGSPGLLDFSHEGFNLGVWNNGGLNGAPPQYAAFGTSFAKFMRKYTQPHSKTGERHVIMAACSQALPDPSTKQSLPEQLIELTDYDDRVVIKAADQVVGIYKYPNGNTHYVDVKNLSAPLETHEFRVRHPAVAQHMGKRAVRATSNKPLI